MAAQENKIIYQRVNGNNTDFQQLVSALDADLKHRDGDDHVFYAQLNKTAKLEQVIVAYAGQLPVGCGAIRPYSADTMEIKRMYTVPDQRGKGIASGVLRQLEHWATELGYTKCLLETGKNQPEAIQLYKKNNYYSIPNFGHYAGVFNSVCFEKYLAD